MQGLKVYIVTHQNKYNDGLKRDLMKQFNPFKPTNWQLAHGRSLQLGPKGIVMGILNVTPDSFSDGGKFSDINTAVKRAKLMYRQGAAIIDVGGESTRPGAEKITAKQEQARVLPIIEALSQTSDCLISIDTYRASTAKLAIKAGAHIINDVWGLQKNKNIGPLIAKAKAGCVLMHTGRERVRDSDPLTDQFDFLEKTLNIAKASQIESDQIILDPGFGFAKNTDENIALLANLEALLKLGHHILTGASRKRFIGEITGRAATSRDTATAATTVIARLKGSAIFRVHNVKANIDALAVADAVLSAKLV